MFSVLRRVPSNQAMDREPPLYRVLCDFDPPIRSDTRSRSR